MKMDCIIKHGFKIVGVGYILLAMSLVGCSGEQGYSTTGSHSPIIVAGDDVENVNIDNDVTNPATETLAEGCSEETHAAGGC